MDLKELIEYDKNYEKKIKEIVYRIILGLNILHSNGIIHNDIKPANILINDQYHSSICDFGSFTFLGELPKSFTLTFASPELLMNSKDINGKSDMFSLGLTILCCAYRREQSIFEQKDNQKKQLDYLKDFFSNTPNKLYEKYIKNIEDRDLRDLLKNLLTWEPEKRFSAEDALNSNYFKDLYPSKDGIEKIHFPIYKNKIQKKKIEPKEFYDLFDQIKKYLKV